MVTCGINKEVSDRKVIRRSSRSGAGAGHNIQPMSKEKCHIMFTALIIIHPVEIIVDLHVIVKGDLLPRSLSPTLPSSLSLSISL